MADLVTCLLILSNECMTRVSVLPMADLVTCLLILSSECMTRVSVLSMADLVTCLLVLFSGIAKGVAADSLWWQLFDVYLHLGCGAVSTTASITTTVMVTVERLITIR